jgi:hypothetical protein
MSTQLSACVRGHLQRGLVAVARRVLVLVFPLVLPLVLALPAGRAEAKPAKRHAAARRPAPSHTQERSVAPPPPIAEAQGASEGSSEGGGDGAADEAKPAPDAKGGAKNVKTKTYTFGAMDVEGKLKTPQLLYFLNRVKLELDMSAPDKRSFMKELGQSADDKSL